MTQHINLLRSERGDTRDALQLTPVVIAAAVTLALAGAATWHATQALGQSQVQAKIARAAALAAAPKANGAPALDDTLSRQLTQARERLAQIDTVNSQLRELDGKDLTPFSTLMDALARRTLEGVWLTALTADGSAQRLTLSGRATEPQRIPLYLKNLNQEASLRERRFQAMDIRERELGAGNRVVEFRLSTAALGKAGS